MLDTSNIWNLIFLIFQGKHKRTFRREVEEDDDADRVEYEKLIEQVSGDGKKDSAASLPTNVDATTLPGRPIEFSDMDSKPKVLRRKVIITNAGIILLALFP
jgi:hypothetical protein